MLEFIKDISHTFMGTAILVRDTGDGEYYALSGLHKMEVLVFPADETGAVLDWMDLYQAVGVSDPYKVVNEFDEYLENTKRVGAP